MGFLGLLFTRSHGLWVSIRISRLDDIVADLIDLAFARLSSQHRLLYGVCSLPSAHPWQSAEREVEITMSSRCIGWACSDALAGNEIFPSSSSQYFLNFSSKTLLVLIDPH